MCRSVWQTYHSMLSGGGGGGGEEKLHMSGSSCLPTSIMYALYSLRLVKCVQEVTVQLNIDIDIKL